LNGHTAEANSYLKAIADILNQKQIGNIYDIYQHNAVWHLSEGDLYGRDAIIREYTQLLAAFPDLRYRSVDSIWIDDHDDGIRLLELFEWSGTNSGYSIMGPTTEKSVTISGLRIMRWRQGRIIEEWIQDDRLHLILQLGLDPAEAVKLLKQSLPLDFTWDAGTGEVAHTIGQTTPDPWPEWSRKNPSPGLFVKTLLAKVWNWRLLQSVDDIFADDCRFDLSGGLICEDLDGYKADVLNRLAAFSDLTMLGDDIFWKQTSASLIEVALRWTMIGTQDGYSSYGPPSGARICIPGISRIQIKNARIVNYTERFGEWVLLGVIGESINTKTNPNSKNEQGNNT
jgi:predicted ester cyclase